LRKIKFSPAVLKDFFDIKVREMCRSCKRFGSRATCPPYVESIDYYSTLLPTYKYGALFIEQFKIDDIKNWERLGRESSQAIHKEILSFRTNLISNGHHYAIGFTAGSCKNCEKCAFPCRFPDKSLIPIEATGIDVVKLTRYVAKIEIKFPVTTEFYRVGIILWD